MFATTFYVCSNFLCFLKPSRRLFVCSGSSYSGGTGTGSAVEDEVRVQVKLPTTRFKLGLNDFSILAPGSPVCTFTNSVRIANCSSQLLLCIASYHQRLLSVADDWYL
jgi:hypothetical protein